MSNLLLIYKTATPISRARHADCSVEVSGDYGFSSTVNSVPLMAVEFPEAAAEYAIVFAGNDGEVLPAVILGVRDNENLFLSDASTSGSSTWGARYIPAFVRRYPFVFSRSNDQFLLCVDEQFAGFNREGRGRPLFNPDGTPSDYTDRVLKFLQEYQAQYLRTQAFCRKVQELDLLETMQADVVTDTGERMSLTGFKAINREKLKALPPEKLAELAKTDELELLYLHIQSMRNFEALKDRISKSRGQTAESAQTMPELADPELADTET